ncbi:MAG: Lead, cadmium, zinc and mercury transporting ATPase [Candidatus Saccharibacteria bacterium]|nr:Lead, cadmium, zinc and mercury transporting ATPase [Candidatus Saccharibacteria bacterium]
MQRLAGFLRRYKLFSVALSTLLIALALQLNGYQTAAHWLLGIVTIIELMPLLSGMWQDFRHGKYGIDILAATAIIASVVLGEYWAGIVVVLMLTGGEALEDYAEHRAKSELDTLLEHAPQKAHVIRKGKTIDVRVSELKVGDKILIKPGELVPVDAVILEGIGSFDESSLTGESLPQDKEIGEQLLSGSVNVDGAVTAKATATAEDSQYQQIVKLVKSAASAQAPFVRLADRYSIPFTIFAFAIAIGVWVLTGDAIRFLEVIIVATPCPLLLAAPIALISGMSRASKYGIIVKTGSALERLAEAKTIAFDKTGTLTSGHLEVDGIKVFNGFKEDEVLALAASLEQNSNHVLAHAIVNAAQAKKLKFSKAKHVKEIAGRGVQAQLKGQAVLVGRFSLLEDNGVGVPSNFKHTDIKDTAAYVAVDGQLAGIIKLKDEVRSNSKATIEQLRALGIQNVIMVTGDNKSTALAVAKKLGIQEVHADCLPADKLRIIDESSKKPIIFVGDGVNDAPVLTSASVGIALGARGSTAASESADMVLMLDDISRVAAAVTIAKRTFKIARQSILIGIGLSLVLMAVFATGKFPPLAGAILQEVVDVVVIFNALRAHIVNIETA